MTNTDFGKSRNLKLTEYLFELEKEYVSAFVRSLLYHKDKDKAFWKRVQDLKEEKIVTVATKLFLKEHAANSQSKFDHIIDTVILKSYSLPELSYRSFEDRVEYFNKELKLFFNVDKSVLILDTNEIGTIKKTNVVSQMCEVDCNNQIKHCKFVELKSLIYESKSR